MARLAHTAKCQLFKNSILPFIKFRVTLWVLLESDFTRHTFIIDWKPMWKEIHPLPCIPSTKICIVRDTLNPILNPTSGVDNLRIPTYDYPSQMVQLYFFRVPFNDPN